MPSDAEDQASRATSRARRLATPTELAVYLQVPVRTLYTWRYQRKGPRVHRVGRHLRYRWEDVEDWLASKRSTGDEIDGEPRVAVARNRPAPPASAQASRWSPSPSVTASGGTPSTPSATSVAGLQPAFPDDAHRARHERLPTDRRPLRGDVAGSYPRALRLTIRTIKLRREAGILKRKSIASLRCATKAFNFFEDDGRVTDVLLHLQHAFEMLLKAALVQRRVPVFDRKLGQAIGFEKCVNLGSQDVKLTGEEAGTLRAIDALRDDQQHWYNYVSEGLLYTHARAAVTLFDDLLQREFEERLVDHLPHRVLPISSEPPRDIQLLIDEEYRQIGELLQPGRRRRPEAQARIRSLLAMEAHVAEGVQVSRKDVAIVQRAILAGKPLGQVFPRLGVLGTEVAGDGVQVTVRFSKTKGAPVRLVGADEDVEAAAIREVDLQRKYRWSPSELATKLKLTGPRALALRRYLTIDEDLACRHTFVFGSQKHVRFSDNAFTRMRDALETVDMAEVWENFGPGRHHHLGGFADSA